jgi:glycine/serine hydroxymethyltransferase
MAQHHIKSASAYRNFVDLRGYGRDPLRDLCVLVTEVTDFSGLIVADIIKPPFEYSGIVTTGADDHRRGAYR